MATRRAVQQALATQSAAVSRAYVEAIKNKKIVVNEIEAMVASGNAAGLASALNVTNGDISSIIELLRTAAVTGGDMETAGRRTAGQGIDPNTEKTAQYLQRASSAMVTAINSDKLAAIQEILATNAMLGMNPRATALDLVGRVAANGRREGGIIGLNQQQAAAVSNARVNLLSGDPEKMAQYLNNTRRDSRYDGIVKTAIANGTPVSQANVARIVTRYQARLLQTRGETIARTETISALNHGRQEKVASIAEATGGVVWKRWSAVSGARHDHAEANGQEVQADEPFNVGGYDMMYPGDTSGGAPAGETINCRCSVSYSVKYEDDSNADNAD